MNIEVKAPYTDSVKARYNFQKSAAKVYDLIRRFCAENHCMVSSFDADVLAEIDRLNLVNNTQVKTIYLYNFYEHRELPDPDIYA